MNIRNILGACVYSTFFCLSRTAEPQAAAPAGGEVVQKFDRLRAMEALSRKSFDLRPITPGFESTDLFDLQARLQILTSVQETMKSAPQDQELSVEERLSLGLGGFEIKSLTDVLKHYQTLERRLRAALLNEEKRVTKNIAYQVLRVGLSSDLAPSLKSKDTIEIRLAGKLSPENIKNDLQIEVFQTPLPEDIRAQFKNPRTLEESLNDDPELLRDMDLTQLKLKVELKDGTPELVDPAAADGEVLYTRYFLHAPEIGWPKESALIIFVRDSMNAKTAQLPVRGFFKVYQIKKD